MYMTTDSCEIVRTTGSRNSTPASKTIYSKHWTHVSISQFYSQWAWCLIHDAGRICRESDYQCKTSLLSNYSWEFPSLVTWAHLIISTFKNMNKDDTFRKKLTYWSHSLKMRLRQVGCQFVERIMNSNVLYSNCYVLTIFTLICWHGSNEQ